jgi:hypothetical protein
MFSFSSGALSQITGALTSQVKQITGLSDQVKSNAGNLITGGFWKGAGASAFESFVARKYLPAVAQLIAAISGFGGAAAAGDSIFEQAEQKAMSEIGKITQSFNF